MKISYLKLQLLGSFIVDVTGTEFEKFRTVRSKELLIYLALNKDGASRAFLANFFWPNKDEKKQQVNLRQAIAQLIKPIGEEFFHVDDHSIQLNWDAKIFLDAQEFFDAYEFGKLEAAEKLFSGDLVPDFSMLSDESDKWLSSERVRIRNAALDVLHQLTDGRLGHMDYPAAIESARRQLTLDPLRESATFQLMQACAYSGQREEAIAAFDQLEEILADRLAISPKNETFALLNQIEKGEIGTPLTTIEPDLPTPFMAPAVPDYFTGRDVETATLVDLLTNSDHKTVALIGMGGIGKTTLASVTAHQLREAFPDGILWGSLKDSSEENILKLWGQAFGRDFSALSDLNNLAIAVRNTLADKQVLVVLDNAEGDADLELFKQTGEKVRMLVTTRDREVGAAMSHFIDVAELNQETSLQLMGKILNDTDLADNETAKEICDLLEYLPLAVEITAQVLRSRKGVPLERMLERLKDAQHRLGLKAAGVASGMGVRATFEVSWEILNQPLQTLFSNVGIFEGRSFSLEAADSLVETDQFETEDNLHDLAALSLMKWDGEGQRFRQHPLLADFALEKLKDKKKTQKRLVEYYLTFAQEHALNYEALTPEWDNLLATILSLEELEGWEQVLKFTDLLHESWFRFGRFFDADKIYSLAECATRKSENLNLKIRVFIEWSKIMLEQSAYNLAWDKLESSLSLAYQAEEEKSVAQIRYLQSYILFDQGEYQKSLSLLNESIRIFENLEDVSNLVKAKNLQGWLYYEIDKEIDRAQDIANESLSLLSNHEDDFEKISALRLKSNLALKNGDFVSAAKYANQSIEKCDSLNANSEKVSCIYLLVLVYVKTGDLDSAEMWAQQGINLANQFGLLRINALLLHSLSVIYLAKGETGLAKRISTQTIEIYEKIEDRLGYGFALRQLGDIHASLNDSQKANKYWRKAKQVAEHLEHYQLLEQVESRLSNN